MPWVGDGLVESVGKGAQGSSLSEVEDAGRNKSSLLNHHILYMGRQVLCHRLS